MQWMIYGANGYTGELIVDNDKIITLLNQPLTHKRRVPGAVRLGQEEEPDYAAIATFSRTIFGCRAAILNSASAGPSGLRRPCSQLRSV